MRLSVGGPIDDERVGDALPRYVAETKIGLAAMPSRCERGEVWDVVTGTRSEYDWAVAAPSTTITRPEARTMAVEDLVAMVLAGAVRIPIFQRDLAWDSKDVVELFDSVYRGFPIGSLLLQEAEAEGAEVEVGPLRVVGTERSDALWVVDGQQRLTALAVTLGRSGPLPTTPTDPFVVYFDAVTETFHPPNKSGDVLSTWVPLPQLLDGAALSEWVFGWQHGSDAGLRGRVFEAGKRLRDYKVPLYVIRTGNEEVLRTIFSRVNNSGKPLTWVQLHDGLFGRKGAAPSSLSALADSLATLGMGRPSDDELLPCLVAYQGLDVTRGFQEHLRADPTFLEGVAAAALPILRTLLGFLRSACTIPHLRFLPYQTPMVVLTRFFKQHPQVSDRTRILLVRWVWRILLDADPDNHMLRRKGVAAVTSDEEESVQELLRLATAAPVTFVTPTAFDARGAKSRLVLLGMASLVPRTLDDDFGVIDLAGLVRDHDVDAFRPLFSRRGRATSSPGNRVLLPGTGAATTALRVFIDRHGLEHEVLRSHAIDPIVATAIRDGDVQGGLDRRTAILGDAVQRLGDRMAEWGRTDRPSLEYLMRRAAR